MFQASGQRQDSKRAVQSNTLGQRASSGPTGRTPGAYGAPRQPSPAIATSVIGAPPWDIIRMAWCVLPAAARHPQRIVGRARHGTPPQDVIHAGAKGRQVAGEPPPSIDACARPGRSKYGRQRMLGPAPRPTLPGGAPRLVHPFVVLAWGDDSRSARGGRKGRRRCCMLPESLRASTGSFLLVW